MPERLHFTEVDDLDSALRDLARHVSYPPTPNLSVRVSFALLDGDAARPARRVAWRRLWHSIALSAAALLLIAGTALAVGFGLRGLGILFVDEPRPSVGQELDLRERVTLPEAQRRVSYRILLPGASLGPPDEVYLDLHSGVEQVTLLYLPAADHVRDDPPKTVLISQLRARLEPVALKELGPGTSVEPAAVDGGRGFWIEGEPHVLVYVDPSGSRIEDRIRLVGDVLVWERGELILRLEGASSMEQALSIAEAMD